MTRTLICLSGGLDSALVLDLYSEVYDCEVVMFDYGQPHIIELDYATRLADLYGVPSRRIKINAIPLIDDVIFAGRNLVLAAHAIAIAAAEKFNTVAFGCNQSDWERFPDCRPEFWGVVNAAAKAYEVCVALPLLRLSKNQIVEMAMQRNINMSATWSCYSPVGKVPCGVCMACVTRKNAGA